jgi:hypothetical protein
MSAFFRFEIWRQSSRIRSACQTFGNTARTLQILEVLAI